MIAKQEPILATGLADNPSLKPSTGAYGHALEDDPAWHAHMERLLFDAGTLPPGLRAEFWRTMVFTYAGFRARVREEQPQA